MSHELEAAGHPPGGTMTAVAQNKSLRLGAYALSGGARPGRSAIRSFIAQPSLGSRRIP